MPIKGKTYEEWYSTIPKEKSNVDNYNLQRAYELAPEDQLVAFANDPDAHLMSVYENPETGEYEFMKAKNHPTLQMELDWFNGDTDEAKEFRSKYDLVDNGSQYFRYVRKQDKMAQEEEKKAPTDLENLLGSSDYMSRNYQVVTNPDGTQSLAMRADGQVQQSLNDAIEPLDAASKSYDEMLKGFETERSSYLESNKQQVDQTRKASKWGGITEAASALVNLVGATQGATPATWTSPQTGWAQRADNLRKEREATMRSYRQQMSSLEQAKSTIAARKAAVQSQFNTQQQTTLRALERNAGTINKAAAGAQAKAEAAGMKLAADKVKTIFKGVTSDLMKYVAEQGKMGHYVTQAEMDKWAEQTYDRYLKLYGDAETNVAASKIDGFNNL